MQKKHKSKLWTKRGVAMLTGLSDWKTNIYFLLTIFILFCWYIYNYYNIIIFIK
jgi:hypothetical protein